MFRSHFWPRRSMKEGCACGSVGFLEKLRGGYCVRRGLNMCIRPGRAEQMEERWGS